MGGYGDSEFDNFSIEREVYTKVRKNVDID